MKFGGTSVGDAQRIKNVATLVVERGRGNIVVLSAMAGTTNALQEIADYLARGNNAGAQEVICTLENRYSQVIDQLVDDLDRRHSLISEVRGTFNYLRSFSKEGFEDDDAKEILAQGELLSTLLLTQYMQSQGFNVCLLPALDFMRLDPEGQPDMRGIRRALTGQLSKHAGADYIITQGYICRNARGDTDNLRRGGSDYTASIIGAVMQASEVQIWTDIDGMHNGDPRHLQGTMPVPELTFDQAAELAYFGAKILHPTCILPAKLANIPVRLLNTLQPEAPGTVIRNMPPDGTVKAVAAKDGITVIRVRSGRMLMAWGYLKRVFDVMDRYHTPVDMVTTSETAISMTIDDTSDLNRIVEDLKAVGTVSVDTSMTIICIVGDLEWHRLGAETAVLRALDGIPLRMINYGGSDSNVSVLIDTSYKQRALEALAAALFNQ